MNRLSLSALLILGASAAPAFAADLSYAPPPEAVIVEPEADWSGLYIGGAVGGVWSEVDTNEVTLFEPSYDDTGFTGSVYFGYNWQVSPSFVLGVEADASYLGLGFDGEPLRPDWEYLKVDWAFTIAGRAGVLVTPSTLLYLKAGYTGYDLEHDEWGLNGLTDIDDGFKSGVTVGGGIEAALSEHWLIRAEGLYTFGLDDTSVSYGGIVYEFNDLNFATGRVGLAYKF